MTRKHTATPDAARILRRLKRDLQTGVRLLATARDARATGQREALLHVATVIKNLERDR